MDSLQQSELISTTQSPQKGNIFLMKDVEVIGIHF